MTRGEIIKQVQELAEKKGWEVNINSQPTGEETMVFSWETPAGQDAFFNIDVEEKDTLEDVYEKIKDYTENYDPDYEATLWSEDGHGINGAPHRLKDIIEDMEEVQAMLKELTEDISCLVWQALVLEGHKWAKEAVRFDNIYSEWQEKEWNKNMKIAREFYKQATAFFNKKYGYTEEDGWHFCPEIFSGPCNGSTSTIPCAYRGNDIFYAGVRRSYYMLDKGRTTSDDDLDVQEIVAFQKEVYKKWQAGQL